MRLKTLTAAALIPASIAVADVANAGGDIFERFVALVGIDNVQLGNDANSFDNPFIQPQDPAESGGGRDQTLQFGDVLNGGRKDDLQIGGLGIDVLAGNRGDDVQVGGLEHFTGNNRDRAFGGPGKDIFIWKPGDGSDFIDGGSNKDVVMLGLVGEPNGAGGADFEVLNDGQAGEVFLNPYTGLPVVDVTGSPGFCEVIDRYSSNEAEEALEDLDLDHLVRFFIRGQADNGAEDGDNGLRVTLHLRNVEFLVCTPRGGGAVEVLDLRVSPPEPIKLFEIPSRKLRFRLAAIVR